MNTESIPLSSSHGSTTAHAALPDRDSTTREDGAVILIHEWWGINDHVRDIAGRYAREGFICVAPDLFRGRTARDPQEASRLMQSLALEDGVATIASAVSEVQQRYETGRIAITGFCMGGTFALRSACLVDGLKASAPFYGDIPEDATLKALKAPTLFIAGSRDNWITPEKVEGLRESARKYNLPVEVVSYDADHAFFNDTRPEVYNPDAAADAWRRVLAFFREHLGR